MHEVARQISGRSAERIEAGLLTPAQIERFAAIVSVPFGMLFLDAPPAERPLPIADFRSVVNREPLGQEFFDVYDDVVYKQAWFSEHLQSIGASPLPFVGRCDVLATSAVQLAQDIKATLKLSDAEMRRAKSSEELYALIVRHAEDAGVLVFKNGVVGNNTRRGLPVTQFRGFAISDPYAPAVFINGADAKAAWLFTLMHELAHIWLGLAAVSDTLPNDNATEQLCNSAAAEALVPNAEFLAMWHSNGETPAASRIQLIRREFKVSALVVARRAMDAGLIDKPLYDATYTSARNAGADSGGGDFYATLRARNGRRFADTVAALARAGDLGLRHAGRLLNTTPSNVLNYYDRRNNAVSA